MSTQNRTADVGARGGGTPSCSQCIKTLTVDLIFRVLYIFNNDVSILHPQSFCVILVQNNHLHPVSFCIKRQWSFFFLQLNSRPSQHSAGPTRSSWLWTHFSVCVDIFWSLIWNLVRHSAVMKETNCCQSRVVLCDWWVNIQTCSGSGANAEKVMKTTFSRRSVGSEQHEGESSAEPRPETNFNFLSELNSRCYFKLPLTTFS